MVNLHGPVPHHPFSSLRPLLNNCTGMKTSSLGAKTEFPQKTNRALLLPLCSSKLFLGSSQAPKDPERSQQVHYSGRDMVFSRL